ncbi:5-methyltetrahydropteroyltriglutamate--homocysteine S-methyltransferase [Paenibacillus macquariensis]|uniref:5-methyltetrahydropteroyltriglutamate--homocysteine methyltransferase n=1 Tax=Paenibacillus macquariensis TaxID=948756 RepID=A0ABY1K8L1_9BACL|nr:5-methyltetrahydropteroyltriglutamate--homocysteine S-methyltransferase [Paenibacillus macquariensis]MEC0093319.1 5-methyltetrahydropteroyltriglutamate--homocysteine S-methyltransferase [Paenibacillus macquariensis]OAB27524.1 5-methyltetrahydropteroyltriglutamate--homocysteine S-methyltransferase [Paenibacillus macquariensis subsp. macquariensis]SIR41852.1 methionine synthase (B12-independent) [Paenibacillus macquariensis]
MLKSSNLGYPRIGANREWKKTLEAYWAGKLDESQLISQLEDIRLDHLKLQLAKGIELIPVNDFSFYDHILDTSAMFGLVPERFSYDGGVVPFSTYYAMARGDKGAAACEMTKWFNTNYHYIVPELNGAAPTLTENRPLKAYQEAKEKLGIEGKPVLVGLYTFLKLSKGYEPDQIDDKIEQFLPIYTQIVQELAQAGVQWVQIDEPILVTSTTKVDLERIRRIYTALNEAAPALNIMLQTYFEAVDHYEEIISLPVQGFGLDLVHGLEQNLQSIKRFGFPEGKTLGAGLIDGRNIWRSSLESPLQLLKELSEFVPNDRIVVQPSCSLLHVPVSTKPETALDPVLKEALAYADEKLDEIVLLVATSNGYEGVDEKLNNSRKAVEALNASQSRNRVEVREAAANRNSQPSTRKNVFAKRQISQQEKWQLPFLPTTTIGSFPQSPEIRKARQSFRKGDWNSEQYETFIEDQIQIWIKLQEEIGIDVLVHGEFERTDMVEFFGEKLNGFAFTLNGWVQSYGSRCVKPPVIYGDVEFIAPMTVKESVYAQSLTDKPVKGMLTGPLTILNWSFVRDDLPRNEVAFQIALALREEVEALEKAGIEMIQVDEPALREGLPLKKDKWDSYLEDSILAFRLSTSTVKDTTQIHTHMCYCEFHEMIDAIRALDADVISIETSRSHGELIHTFEESTYELGIGLGVYDIHSPRVPAVEEMVSMIDRALQVLDPSLFWINPDCGLKTRGIEETVASLKHMVQATEIAREARSVAN